MKRFLIKTLIFFAIIAIIDIIAGIVFPYMQTKKKGHNEYTKLHYLAEQCHEDILIFGSSRAYRHYNPQIIIDSLNMSCYNCGQSSMGFIHNYPVLKIATDKYQPKMIIYDLLSSCDYEKVNEDYHRYLRGLGPYIHYKGVSDVFNSVDKLERIKMVSNLYAYNDVINGILVDFIGYGENGIINHGFIGTISEFHQREQKYNESKKEIHPLLIDPLKIQFAKKFVEDCKGSKIIFCISPIWTGEDEQHVVQAERLCHELNVPLLDFSNDSKYVHHDEFFLDEWHLNAQGANEYTKDLIKRLRELM